MMKKNEEHNHDFDHSWDLDKRSADTGQHDEPKKDKSESPDENQEKEVKNITEQGVEKF
jgi:hypothetical protein